MSNKNWLTKDDLKEAMEKNNPKLLKEILETPDIMNEGERYEIIKNLKDQTYLSEIVRNDKDKKASIYALKALLPLRKDDKGNQKFFALIEEKVKNNFFDRISTANIYPAKSLKTSGKLISMHHGNSDELWSWLKDKASKKGDVLEGLLEICTSVDNGGYNFEKDRVGNVGFSGILKTIDDPHDKQKDEYYSWTFIKFLVLRTATDFFEWEVIEQRGMGPT